MREKRKAERAGGQEWQPEQSRKKIESRVGGDRPYIPCSRSNLAGDHVSEKWRLGGGLRRRR